MTLLQPLTPTPTVPLPRLTTTVPKEYVHRASLAEVFLTGCTTQHEAHFELTGQWPRAHTFFHSFDGKDHDPLIVAETFRQAGLFLAHAELGVPLGHHFVMWDLTFTSQLRHLRVGSAPTDIELTAICTDVSRRGRTTSGFRMELALRRDGRVIATGGGRFTCVSPAVYSRLRGSRLDRASIPQPRTALDLLPPSAVGRLRPSDVVLSSTHRPDSWLLTPDPDHPVLFDHSGDHLPGMVLLEAARQAAYRCAAPGTIVPSAISTVFHRYAELDEPCWIEATPASSRQPTVTAVEVTGRQGGQRVFTSTVTGPRQRALTAQSSL
ncbi:ScbA/BarX family gamma-butyrolactone biosynthesis protein [Streptomyces sp. Y7]|uniref:ScbA/BarX family gamma-butyrolactone biosynthesis protein n=1 Tax=Streptomyces sp. Y7 TaxID=3342392 RepID=UPI0037218F06